MNELVAFPGIAIVAASIVAGITDVWKFKVYNVLTLPMLVCALAFHGMNSGMEGLTGSIAGLVMAFGLFVIPYGFGAIGAGDVKYMVAVGAWMGPPAILQVTLIGCLATGVYTVGVILYHHRVRETWANLQIMWHRLCAARQYVMGVDGNRTVQEMARQPDRRSRLVPISAMMSVGVLCYLIWHN